MSAGRARAALGLASEGAIAAPEEGLVVAADHPVALLVNADRRLARDIAAVALAPLDGETPASRERLRDTLFAWLRHRGRTESVAAALHVHPQTVRYRMGRLRDLYGERLDDPDIRFELELALRSRGR
ncbi:MAG: helix-turn-helix domain-containing protein [Thermoleophilaceae bacterium]